MNRPPLPEPVRVLRHEMHCGMGISAYLLTDFTVKPMSPQQADKMGYWKHDKHPSPLAELEHAVEQASKNADEVLRLRERVAVLEVDAARFCWLRGHIYIDPKMLVLRIDGVFLRGPLPEALDAAIDAALQGAK